MRRTGEADAKPSDELIAGKYKLVRLLGKGGMGSVWEGVHVTLGSRVAVKFIEHELAFNDEARRRFDNEARAAARLQSRYVVSVHDHGVMPDGRPFIVMEFLRGRSLEERLLAEGSIGLREGAIIVAQVCRALGKAHEQGIIHRDLKPENIFLARSPDDDEEVAKVVDFGIAKFTAAAPGLSSSTQTGTLLGTPFYMSPEQARGLKHIDHRSDLWALGVVAYRSVAGALPFEGEAVGDILVRICTQEPVPPSSLNSALPAAFDAWFSRCVAKEPGDRFQSAHSLAASLLSIAGLAASGERGAQSGALDHQGLSLPLVSVPGLGIPEEAASQVGTGTEAIQMGAVSPVTPGQARRSAGLVGAAVALAGMAFVILGIAGWRLLVSTEAHERAVVASPEPSASTAEVIATLPRSPERLAEDMPDAASVESGPSAAASAAPDESVTSPESRARRRISSPRSTPTAAVPKASSTQPPPRPPGTIDLGY
jgi:serine/threonine-protein kinase